MQNGRQQRKQQKSSSSKYDFVKVRVHLSDQHYYVLSRFLLSRMLTAARVDYGHALRIALDLKKRLVDKNQLDVAQQELQRELFALMKQHGYGDEHVQWYRTLESFHHQRIPLVVLIAGTASTGKSTIATSLSERLNLSSVLKTDVVYDLMHTVIDGKLPPRLWSLPGDDEDGSTDFIDTLVKESKLVCQGLDGDLYKSMTDGKSIIIEGSLVDHGLLDHMDRFVSMQNKGVIVAPFLVTLSEPTLRSLLSQEESTCINRICEYQSHLVEANAKREQQQQRTFHVLSVDMSDIQTTINAMQSIVLTQIAAQVAKQ